jgi:hypothetical protein
MPGEPVAFISRSAGGASKVVSCCFVVFRVFFAGEGAAQYSAKFYIATVSYGNQSHQSNGVHLCFSIAIQGVPVQISQLGNVAA